MAFFALIIMAGAVLLALRMTGKLSRNATELAVIAVLIGVAGYVWQGSPTLPSSAVGDAQGAKSIKGAPTTFP